MPTEHFTLRLQAYLELQEFPKVEWEPECWVISQTIQNCTFILQIKVQFWIVLGAAVGQEVEQPVRPLSSTHIIQGHLRAGACPSYTIGEERGTAGHLLIKSLVVWSLAALVCTPKTSLVMVVNPESLPKHSLECEC